MVLEILYFEFINLEQDKIVYKENIILPTKISKHTYTLYIHHVNTQTLVIYREDGKQIIELVEVLMTHINKKYIAVSNFLIF